MGFFLDMAKRALEQKQERDKQERGVVIGMQTRERVHTLGPEPTGPDADKVIVRVDGIPWTKHEIWLAAQYGALEEKQHAAKQYCKQNKDK